MLKSDLLKECQAAFEASMKAGNVTPSFYPSWTKVQLSKYLTAMRSSDPLSLKISGTLHN